MNVEFEGAEKLMARLDKMSDEAALKKSLETAALLVERSAKQKAQKDTGALRRSITSKVEGLEGIVYTPLEYGPYIEYGTGLFAEEGTAEKMCLGTTKTIKATGTAQADLNRILLCARALMKTDKKS